MMLVDLAVTVVVFDMDDTLYFEADYVDSGVRHVCTQINSFCGVNPYDAIKELRLRDAQSDWLALACELASLKPSVKESLLWMYRLHSPAICLSEGCVSALMQIRSAALACAVLTDGRAVTQRLKLAALGLADLPTYISEDYDSSKPAPDRFQAIQKDYPAEHYVYVADNVQKDFLGCNPLGWISVGMRGNGRNIYSQSTQGLPAAALPAFWVNSWEELIELLLKS